MATTYATVGQLEAFFDAGVFNTYLPFSEEDKEALINAAEDDVDRFLSYYLDRDPVTGRKLDPSRITDAQVGALARATCSQAVFRLEVGDEDILGADSVTAAGGVTFGPTPRPPSPAALEALSGYGFAWRSGTVAPPIELSEAP
jgi:hypothetical protein